ncbi:MAG: hypothetical protein E6Q57_20460 [Mycobacterium sp.]|nr:MAG: hypothetical protein E6Q57_20460 [Mycobacterium sp.]
MNANAAEETARKAVELLLRTVGQAPEQRGGRRLAKQHGESAGDGPRVLIVSPRDWVAHVQYESVIAHALRLRGADVSFLTCGGGLEICDRSNTYEAPPMPCSTCMRYTGAAIEAHGFGMRSIRSGWVHDDQPWPELDEISIPDLTGVVDGGLPLGRLVDIPLKWFLCTADLVDDPLGGQVYRAFLRSARRIARGIASALDERRPDTVLLLNGLFLFEAIAWALCRERGIEVVTYERAFRKETLVFHRGTPAGFYDFSADWPTANRALTESEDAELTDYLEARRRGAAFDQYWKFTENTVDRGRGRLATLFTNLTWDTAVIDRDLAFASIQDWILETIDVFAGRPDDRLVIRVHPSEVALPGKVTRDSLADFVRRAVPDLPGNVVLIEPDDLVSSYPLMERSDVGLVYTSTTGLELALAGTPVVVAGATHYRDKGFTIDVSDPAGFRAALTAVLDAPAPTVVDVELARRYAHFFFFRAPVDAPGVIEPIPGLARLTVDRLDDLLPGRNPTLDRICDGILEGTSFVRG